MILRLGCILVTLLTASVGHAQEAEVEGSLDVAVVRRVLDRGARDALRGCWREARARTGARTGRAVARFTIEADGSVTAPELLSSSLDAPFAECVTAALRPLRFPTQIARSIVTLPLELTEPERRRGPARVSSDPRRPYRITP